MSLPQNSPRQIPPILRSGRTAFSSSSRSRNALRASPKTSRCAVLSSMRARKKLCIFPAGTPPSRTSRRAAPRCASGRANGTAGRRSFQRQHQYGTCRAHSQKQSRHLVSLLVQFKPCNGMQATCVCGASAFPSKPLGASDLRPAVAVFLRGDDGFDEPHAAHARRDVGEVKLQGGRLSSRRTGADRVAEVEVVVRKRL